MIIGERLKNLLKYKHISAREFAAMVGVSEGMIYKYYRMEDTDYSIIAKWADALRIPIVSFTDDFEYRFIIDELTEEEKEELELRRLETSEKYNQLKIDAERELKKAIEAKDRRIEDLMRHIGKLELLLEQNNIDYSTIIPPTSTE